MTSSNGRTVQPPADAFGDATLDAARQTRVDAIRYVVLRKVAPGLRHALLGELQTIQFSAELAARQLHAGVDLAKVRDNVGHIPNLCVIAVRTSQLLIDWITSVQGTTTPVGEGITQCLKFAGDDWFLRGIEATTDLPAADARVSSAILRELVVTGLLILTEMYEQAADLHVTARLVERHVDVELKALPAERVVSFVPTSQYRKLLWADLKTLAEAHGIPCVCEGGKTSLRLPCLDVAQESCLGT